MICFHDLSAAASHVGLTAIDRGSGHWQVVGGVYLVNVYPFAKQGPTMYVAGSAKGRRLRQPHLAISEILAATADPPRVAKTEKSKRRTGSTRGAKQRLMRKDPRCYWCQNPLVLKREEVGDGKRFATLDHKMPLGAGGIDNANNRVLACEECNQARGDRPGAPIPAKGGRGNASQR